MNESRRRTDALILAVIAGAAVVAFANALGGAFVYDDLDQIVGNELIRDSRYFWKAVLSDPWAFQGDRAMPWIGYWRPVHVLWWMLNYRLFGLDHTFGWHGTNLLMYIGVCFVSYGLLRCLGVGRAIAAAMVLIFTVHPAHVESVAWISASNDVLASFGAVGALWCELSAGQRGHGAKRIAAAALFVFGLLAKEVCIIFPAIVFVAVLVEGDGGRARRQRVLAALRRMAPYAVLTAAYLVARIGVLGQIMPRTPWEPGFFSAVATIPSMLAFYIRQAFLPIWIGPSYPLRPVTLENIGLVNFFAPLIGVAASGFLLLYLCHRRPVRQLGLAMFVLPLLPTMNVNVFIPEQLVHDRYLCMPLLGMLMIVGPALASRLERVFAGHERKAHVVLLAIIGAVGATLTIQTMHCNRVWASELALWEGSVRSDPFSAFNCSRYGMALYRAGRLREAGIAAERAIQIDPKMTYSYLLRADIAIEERRFANAEKDLRLVLSWFDSNPEVYKPLAICLQQQGKTAEAIDLLRQARGKLPYCRVSFTDRLAAVLREAGRKDEALAELESVRTAAKQEYGPGARLAIFHLGLLYAEAGRVREARNALQEYLSSTHDFRDPPTVAARAIVRERLSELGGA